MHAVTAVIEIQKIRCITDFTKKRWLDNRESSVNNSNSKTNLVACEGYYKDTINYGSGPTNAKLLINDENGGKDSFVDTWYPIPLARVGDTINTYQGTY